jgi:putative tryptophan/tyrosine transport system substrate-binding protein
MRRREFIAGLGGAAAWPLAVRAQQPAVPVIGYLALPAPDTGRDTGFHRGLAETGYVEGRNLTVEYRWAEFRLERLRALADDLVRRHVDVIVAIAAPAVFAAKEATNSIPIVFQIGVDPVNTGVVASLNRPGGNLTGFSILLTELAAKRLELLHELVPTATSIAVLVDPERIDFNDTEMRELQVAAGILKLQLLVLNARDPSEFEAAFATLVRERAGGLLVSGYQLFGQYSLRLVALAAKYGVPAIYASRVTTAAGGLMSYGGSGDIGDVRRQVGVYAGRILKGERPADLPVQQATKIELAINMKTAKALGVTFPLTLLGRADEVIE